MDAEAALASLQKAGTEQNRQTYRRHGAPDPVWGVSWGTLRSLAKQIKVNQDLAQKLWASGNTDARTLAALVADPARLDAATAARWIAEARYHVLVDEVAGVIARSSLAITCMAEWVGSDDEWLARAGWTVMSRLAAEARDVPDASFTPYIAMIERRIAEAPDRVKAAMNRALIAIGCRSAEMAEAAIAAARRIGPVDVDHGDTACQTPDAEAYIRKTRGRQGKKNGAPAPRKAAKARPKAKAKANAKAKPKRKASQARRRR